MGLFSNLDSISSPDVLHQISLRQVLINLVIWRKLREIVVSMGGSPAEHQIIEVLLTEFILRHDFPQQMVVLTNERDTSNSGL